MKNATLYIDQYGNRFYARTVKQLRLQIGMGGSRVSRMFADSKNGDVLHVGYVIGSHWLTAYAPCERKI